MDLTTLYRSSSFIEVPDGRHKPLSNNFSEILPPKNLQSLKIGCKGIHGPHVQNFQEVYQLLNKIRISSKIKSINQGISIINKYLKSRPDSKKIFQN